MAASGGISGVAVALATAGGVMLYAGFQGLSPLDALKDITNGKTRPLEPSQTTFMNDPTRIGQGGDVMQAAFTGSGAGIGGQLVAAAYSHKDELYSQSRRWEKGYSDCSSFIGKCFKDCGITPPSGSVTGSYLTWTRLRTVSKSDIQPGDLLCAAGHIAMATSATTAIGQQNGRQNVRTGSIDSVMWGQSWVPRRYVGPAPYKSGHSSSSSNGSTGAGSFAA